MIFSWFGYSQDLVNSDKYEIYGTLIGEQGYQFYPVNFGIPNNLKFGIKDSTYKEIEKIDLKPIRKFNYLSPIETLNNMFIALIS